MLLKLIARKLTGNFIFDGILLMMLNFLLMFAFGIIFELLFLWNLVFSEMRLTFLSKTLIVFFTLICLSVWLVFGKSLSIKLIKHRWLKVLLLSIIGSAPIILVFIYANLLFSIEGVRRSISCSGGLLVFSFIALSAIIAQTILLIFGMGWSIMISSSNKQ